MLPLATQFFNYFRYIGIKNPLDTLNVTFLSAQGIYAPDCF